MHKDIDVAELVRRALKGGHTTRSLGETIGMSQPNVSRLATGKIKPAMSMLAGLRLIGAVGGSIVLPEEPAAKP